MNISKFTKPARKALKLKKCGAVIVAAGSASRMGVSIRSWLLWAVSP